MVTVYSPRYRGSAYDFYPARRTLGSDMFYPSEDLFPKVEIVQEGGEYRLSAEVPGLDKDDIRVSVRDRVLTLSGERRSAIEEELGECRCSERYYGAFERSFPLPANANEDKIEAILEKGVLTITMPVPEEGDLGRQVEVAVH